MQKFILSSICMAILISAAQTCKNQKNCGACQTLSIGTFCGKCYNTFYNRSTRKCEVPENPIPNCVEYFETDSSSCRRCEYGYGLNKLSVCEKCPEGCAICDTDSQQCASKFGGIIPSKSNSLTDPVKTCNDPQCDICDATGNICLKCKGTLSLTIDLKCSEGLEGCQILSSANAGKCALCDYEYFINDDNLCTKNSDHKESLFSNIYFWLAILGTIVIGLIVYLKFVRKSGRMDDNYLLNPPTLDEDAAKINSQGA
jgi:hypothetical protein